MFYVLMYQVHCDPYQNDDIIFFFYRCKTVGFFTNIVICSYFYINRQLSSLGRF